MEIAAASKGEVTVRFVTVLVAIVCLLGVGAPLGSCSAASEGKLCCDEACSRKFPEDTDYEDHEILRTVSNSSAPP